MALKRKLYYIANIRLPTEKAHGNQIMSMCQSFADEGYGVELWVSSRATSINADPFEYYGIKRNFKIKRVWCLDWVRFGKIGFLIETATFSHSALFKALFKDGLFYTRDMSVALHLKMALKKVAWESHTAVKDSWLTKLLIKHLKLVVISRGLKNYYETLGAKNILVAHDGVSLERYRPELPLNNNKTVFGYIGKYRTMGESKGVDELVEAFLELDNPLTELRIVGLNPGEKIADNPRVKAIEHLPAKDVPKHLLACDVLVMNYPRTAHYGLYMSPLKLFEYMAAQKPIILPDLPSLQEVLNQNEAYFFKAGDTAALRETMREVLDNPLKAKEKARLARQKVEGYTWGKRARQILSFIDA